MKQLLITPLLSVVLSALVSVANAEFEVPTPSYEAPGVLISFQGGLSARNIAEVIAALTKNGVTLSTEEIEVQDGDTICKILVARNFPPECDQLLKLVDSVKSNPQILSRPLKVGEKLNFPKFQINRYRSINNYPESLPKQVALGKQAEITFAGMSKNYPKEFENYKSKVLKRDGSLSIEYWSYEIFLPVSDDIAARKLVDVIYKLGLSNVYVDPIIHSGSPAKLHNQSSDEIKELCNHDKMADKPYHYKDILENDAVASGVIADGLPGTPRQVAVTVIDVEIAKSPSLWPAFGDVEPPSPKWSCKWGVFDERLHHATHLANIIFSNTKFGFSGVASSVKLRSFLWWKLNGDKLEKAHPLVPIYLANDFTQNSQAFPLPIYLMATEFDKLQSDGKEISRLFDPSQRFNRLTLTIEKSKPLLIVAAGQRKSASEKGEELELRSNISPQNLGDFHNVIVVTACEICEHGAQKLLPSANYSRKGEFLVHLAAPGGAKLPGWISGHEVGASAGTSQAAAYVAGVAAAMIGNFPENYAAAVDVKKRLQATSWPLSLKDTGSNPDSSKLTTGVVDPQLALLDPRNTWVKDATGWRSISVKSDLPKFGFTQQNGAERTIDGDHILRFVKVPAPSPARWIVYTDLVRVEMDGIEGAVGRTALVEPDADAALTLCDGSKIKLSDIDDLIPRMGVGIDACAMGAGSRPSGGASLSWQR